MKHSQESVDKLFAELHRGGGFGKEATLAKALGMKTRKWASFLELLASGGKLRKTGDKVWEQGALSELTDRVVALLGKLQQSAAWKPGWRREELGKLLGLKTGRDDGLPDLLEALADDGTLHRHGTCFVTADHTPYLCEELQAKAEQLLANLRADGISPRDWELALAQVAPESKANRILGEHLLGLTKVQQLTDKIVVHHEALRAAHGLLVTRSQGEPFTTSQAREWLDTSRKYIIPVLEWMDSQEWTSRDEDERVTRPLPVSET